MNRCARIAALCTGEPTRMVRLAEIREPVDVCEPCFEAAQRLGMDPKPVPTWLARGLTGQNGIHDLTGQARVA